MCDHQSVQQSDALLPVTLGGSGREAGGGDTKAWKRTLIVTGTVNTRSI